MDSRGSTRARSSDLGARARGVMRRAQTTGGLSIPPLRSTLRCSQCSALSLSRPLSQLCLAASLCHTQRRLSLSLFLSIRASGFGRVSGLLKPCCSTSGCPSLRACVAPATSTPSGPCDRVTRSRAASAAARCGTSLFSLGETVQTCRDGPSAMDLSPRASWSRSTQAGQPLSCRVVCLPSLSSIRPFDGRSCSTKRLLVLRGVLVASGMGRQGC